MIMNYKIDFYSESEMTVGMDVQNEESKLDGGTAELLMRVSCDDGEALFQVGYKIRTSGWDEQKQRCLKGSMHGKDGNVAWWVVNSRIGEMKRLAQEVLSGKDDRNGIESVARELRETLGWVDCTGGMMMDGGEDRQRRIDEDMCLPDLVRLYVAERGTENTWAEGTAKKYEELISYLASYDPKARVSDVSNLWMTGFMEWFATLGVRNNTTKVLLDMLKWFLRWAESMKMEMNPDWMLFRPHLKVVPRKVVFLEWTELMRVWELKIEDTALQQARDLFCLQCFTSLRYSDVSRLKHSQVKEHCIEVVTQKTHERLVIELNKYAKSIIERYRDLEGEYAMPRMTVQRANLSLKRIGKLAGLDEPLEMVWYVGKRRVCKVYEKWEILSTHCGRRTFICNSLAMGIPPETVMKWTGHSDYKAMKPYIEVADETKRRQMAKWDEWQE